MVITGERIEALRNQMGLPIKNFCGRLAINVVDYAFLMGGNNTGRLPLGTKNVLRAIMCEEERTNILAYKDKFPPETAGYFSSGKILQHLDKLYQLNYTPGEAGPVTVEFHPSWRCQHACPYLPFAIPKRGERENFDIRLLDGLIEDLKALDVRGIDISGGGEPLCHPDIGKIIGSFVEEFDTGLVTNGYGLSDKSDSAGKSELRSVILKCTWCRVSVDAGSQPTYSLMHGDRPHIRFDDIVHKIELLAADKVKTGSNTTLGISFLLTPYNFLDLIPSINIFRNIEGLDYFQIKPLVINPSERIRERIIFWDKKLFEILGTIKSYETEDFKIFAPSYKFFDMVLYEGSGLPFQKCWGHPFYPTVSADGSVLVCCLMLNRLLNNNNTGVYGKITEDVRFIDIWNSESRWKKGDGVQIGSCPCNCKLSETNKLLENIYGQKVMHKNFIN
jgi:MoaA/NifB/PqqE/SkfB family radical SAM enzyme